MDTPFETAAETPLLNALYYGRHHHGIVPSQTRSDFARIADTGAAAVTVPVLEQDFDAADRNLEHVFEEAGRADLGVYLVPSRWCGLVAGAPKVPSSFAASRPASWSLNADGTPVLQGHVGPVCSLFDPAVTEYFEAEVERWARAYPVAGFLWDELKPVDFLDYHPLAVRAGGGAPSQAAQLEAAARFLTRIGAAARRGRSGVRRGLFLYAHCPDPVIDRLAACEELDDFGCDGRPWRREDPVEDPQHASEKVLLGTGERFLDAARRHGKRSLFLAENHNIRTADGNRWLDKRLPEVLALRPGHLLFYYFPRNVFEPEQQFSALRRHFRNAFPRPAKGGLGARHP